MAPENIIDKNIKSLCYLLLNLETRIAIKIMTDQHHDCEEDIVMFNTLEIITQL